MFVCMRDFIYLEFNAHFAINYAKQTVNGY